MLSQELSENRIKQVMLRYLKTHYKYRIGADGQQESKLDQRGQGGIIADGYIAFKLDDETPFKATFEATSKASQEEVLFRPRTKILMWDSISAGLFIVNALYLLFYELSMFMIKIQGLLMHVLTVVLGMFVIGIIYYFSMRRNRRYRYIYAVEQFKQYHADDQWIALGEDVFDNPEAVEMEELKRQCVTNGFGLVVIDYNDDPHLVIAPAREKVMSGKRKDLQFVNRKETIANRTFGTFKSLWDRIWSFFSKGGRNWSFVRFQSASYARIIMMGFSACFLAALFWIQLRDTVFAYPSEQDWQRKLSEIDHRKEPTFFNAEKENLTPFEKREANYLDLLPEEAARPIDPQIKEIEVFVPSDSRLFTYYDCSRLYTFSKRKCFIKWRSFDEFETAKSHVIRMMQRGFRCNVVWHGCFEGKKQGYIVFLGLIYQTEKEAQRKANSLQDELQQKGEKIDEMSILVIR